MTRRFIEVGDSVMVRINDKTLWGKVLEIDMLNSVWHIDVDRYREFDYTEEYGLPRLTVIKDYDLIMLSSEV